MVACLWVIGLVWSALVYRYAGLILIPFSPFSCLGSCPCIEMQKERCKQFPPSPIHPFPLPSSLSLPRLDLAELLYSGMYRVGWGLRVKRAEIQNRTLYSACLCHTINCHSLFSFYPFSFLLFPNMKLPPSSSFHGHPPFSFLSFSPAPQRYAKGTEVCSNKNYNAPVVLFASLGSPNFPPYFPDSSRSFDAIPVFLCHNFAM